MTANVSPATLRHGLATGSIEGARQVASLGLAKAHDYIADPCNREVVECALRIRAVETALYELFGRGKLHGTIHTCVGQEFSGAVLSRLLRENDYVTSNHRCHGHFIGATGNWRGLIDEIIGNQEGVCAGIGSSQHLWARNFISNGQQGGLLPVAAGVALDRKARSNGGAVVSFLGEGTFGEGIVYETFNLDALWDLPHVIICENNFYSQSTPQAFGVAGALGQRAAAFSLAVEEADSWNLSGFQAALERALDRAREQSKPSFLVLATYRLNPHSKGDDQRDRAEIDWFRNHDPASLAMSDYAAFKALYADFADEASAYAEAALCKPALPATRYFDSQLPTQAPDCPVSWRKLAKGSDADTHARMAQQLNAFYADYMRGDGTSFFLGEDIADPYGGAFKVSRGLTTEFPERALTTPISEAAITGAAIGLAISGRKAFVEIMFGDFVTYAFDQLVNNASKMFHMYNRQLHCPVVVRMPMGGRRGYGPTHSQSLERFLIGLDNCCTISLNSLAPAGVQLAALRDLQCPAVLIENKSDYAARPFAPPEGMIAERDDFAFPTLRIRPRIGAPDVTLLAYGGMARFVADALIDIFDETDEVPELLVPTSVSPLNLEPIAQALAVTRRLVVIEEGAGFGSVGAEAIAQLQEASGSHFLAARVSGKAAPIPSAPALERAALPSVEDICAAIIALRRARP